MQPLRQRLAIISGPGVKRLPRSMSFSLVRLRDERGAILALRLRPGQVRTLANGPGGIVAAQD